MQLERWVRGLLVASLIVAQSVAAQSSAEPQRGLRRDPAERLRVLEAPPPALDVELPELPSQMPVEGGVLVRIAVRKAVFEGSTVLDPVAVRAILDPLEGRTVNAEDVLAARLALTRLYVDAGYVTSGVVVPDQDASDGTLRFRALEGRLTRIELRGAPPRLNRARLLRGLDALRAAPLRLTDLQRELTRVDADPRIERIEAELLPAAAPGEATLVLDISTRRPFEVIAGVDNHRAPSLGGEQGFVTLRHYSLLGISDVLTLDYAGAEGLDDWRAAYDVPLGASPWSLELAYSRSDSTVIEEPFDRIDIESDSRRTSVGFVREIVARADEDVRIGLLYDRNESETTLLGVPFSFAPGVVDGRAEVDVARLRVDWSRRALRSAWALRSVLSAGLDVREATINTDGLPDGRFVALFSQLQYLRALGDAAQLLVNAELQLTNDSLLPLEKYALGGWGSVRGYRQNQIVRDNAWVVSAEYRRGFGATVVRGLSWAAFVDAGRGWNSAGFAPGPETLASVGLGLRWQPDSRWTASLDFAHGFDDFGQAEHDLQDSGIHFALGYRWH